MAVVARLRNEAITLADRDVGEGRRCPAAMAAEGVHVPEHWHGLDDTLAGDCRAHREVAGGHRLGHRHDVGFDAEVLAREPGAGTSEAGDHLVDDQQHVVAVADLAHPREVACRRNLHAMRLHDGLGDEGCDEFRPFALDVLFEKIGAIVAILLVAHAERIAVAGRAGNEAGARNAGLGDVARAEPVGDRERPHGGAVIGVPARDDLVCPRLAAAMDVVLLGELQRRFDRLRSAADKHHAVEPPGASCASFAARRTAGSTKLSTVPT